MIRRITGDIIGIDSDNPHPLRLAFPGKAGERRGEMNHERAMIAEKDHDKTVGATELGQAMHLASAIWQGKIGCSGPQRQHESGENFRHDAFMFSVF